jgi:hypothetical protein
MRERERRSSAFPFLTARSCLNGYEPPVTFEGLRRRYWEEEERRNRAPTLLGSRAYLFITEISIATSPKPSYKRIVLGTASYQIIILYLNKCSRFYDSMRARHHL